MMPSLLAPMVFSFTPPIAPTLPERLISPVMAISLTAGLPRASDTRVQVIATPAEGPSLPIYSSGKLRCISLVSRKWLEKQVEVMYLAQEQPSWQLYFITSCRLPVTIRLPTGAGSLGLDCLMLAAAASMYKIDPPQELYASPTMTPLGGKLGYILAYLNSGWPRYCTKVLGVMVLSNYSFLTYFSAVLQQI